MSLQCGIVGLPNVGKSTIFNALTKSHSAESANYPFCTIDPNVGLVEIPDSRLKRLIEIVNPQNAISAMMEFVDIAGLVKGASKGEGLGNQFLTHIRQVDAILHVVRCFDDENISHVHGKIEPSEDIEIVEMELIFSDFEQVKKRLQAIQKKKKAGDKDALSTADILEKVFSFLEKGKPASMVNLSSNEKSQIQDMSLLTLKPVLFIGNIPEEDISAPETNKNFQKLKELADQRNSQALALSGKIEAELTQLEKEEENAFLQDLGLAEPSLNRIIRAAYKLLGYLTYFTAGEKEVRAWTITKGSTAPVAASAIHSDIERGFIRAEVTSYEDINSFGSQKAAQEAGKMRVEGKDYIVNDGDVIYFRFNI